jgi:predicted regulator of Ras-like GTPase activity (Roadblock/LC7/MglB family)
MSSSVPEDVVAAPQHPHIQELQETVSRLSAHKGVTAVLILNRQGDILAQSSRTNSDDDDDNNSDSAATSVQQLFEAAQRHVHQAAADDDVSFCQIRTQQGRELYLAPHEGYVLAVLKGGGSS